MTSSVPLPDSSKLLLYLTTSSCSTSCRGVYDRETLVATNTHLLYDRHPFRSLCCYLHAERQRLPHFPCTEQGYTDCRQRTSLCIAVSGGKRYPCNSTYIASFPVPHPAFRRLQYGKAGTLPYCKRRKAGHGTGNEANSTPSLAWPDPILHQAWNGVWPSETTPCLGDSNSQLV